MVDWWGVVELRGGEGDNLISGCYFFFLAVNPPPLRHIVPMLVVGEKCINACDAPTVLRCRYKQNLNVPQSIQFYFKTNLSWSLLEHYTKLVLAYLATMYTVMEQ